MTKLIKIDTNEYPISDQDFKSRFPNTAFPNQIDYQNYGYAVVFPAPQPTTAYNQSVREIAPVLTDKGWYEQQWEVVNFSETMTPEDYQLFIENYKKQRIEQLASLRYEKEIAGIEINGIKIKTDRESQSLINGAYVSTLINPNFTIDWKGENGWININAQQITGIATAVATHVQACFTREKELQEQINNNHELEIVW